LVGLEPDILFENFGIYLRDLLDIPSGDPIELNLIDLEDPVTGVRFNYVPRANFQLNHRAGFTAGYFSIHVSGPSKDKHCTNNTIFTPIKQGGPALRICFTTI
jgi:hypothetical protein